MAQLHGLKEFIHLKCQNIKINLPTQCTSEGNINDVLAKTVLKIPQFMKNHKPK
jgi:hypothetical protein